MFRALFASVLCLSLTTSLQAETVYKYTDEDGNTVFTDEPTTGAEQLDVKPVPTVPALKVPQTPSPKQSEKPFEYKEVRILAPENEENFINNGGKVTVQVATTPQLRGGDKVQLYFNGAAKGEPTQSTRFPFENLDRGSYEISAEIIGKDGKSLGRSEPITFFIRRASKLN